MLAQIAVAVHYTPLRLDAVRLPAFPLLRRISGPAGEVEPRRSWARPNAMAAFFAELLFDLARSLVGDWLRGAVVAVGTWLEPRLQSPTARFVVGGLLGLAAYFLIPVIIGLLGL